MINLIQFFVRKYVLAISIFLAIALFGLVASTTVGVDLLPNFELSFVTVNTVYPGAGPAEVALQVSEPLEDALATLPGIKTLSSLSFEGLSVVFIEFNAGVDAAQAAVDVSQRVNAVAASLPSDARAPSVQRLDPNEAPLLNIAVVAEAEDLRDIQRLTEEVIEPEVQLADGVASVSIIGPINREVQVLLDPQRLELFGLTPQQVAGAIGASSLDVPLGNIIVAGERILLTGRATLATLAQVEALQIDSSRGLRLTDVAVVRDGSADITAYSRLNGEPVVLLEVLKQSGANSVATAQAIRNTLRQLELPENYQTFIVADSTPFISNTVNDTIGETLRAILVVSIIVLMFIGRLGSVFSVIIAIPISFAGALILFGLLGFTFNIVTLLAITVAVGLVVDDSIVVAEAIDRYREAGHDKLEAVRLGAGEVSVAVLASTLSLLAVFLPISFLPGILGQFFAEFGLTLTATIVASYLEALFFLTVRLAYLPDPFPPGWEAVPKALGRLSTDLRFVVHRFWLNLWYYLITCLSAVLIYLVLFIPDLVIINGFRTYNLWGVVTALPAWFRTPVGFGALVLAVSLLFPLLLALSIYLGRLIVMVLAALGRSLYDLTDWATVRVREAYGRALSGALRHSNAVLIGALILFASVFVIAPQIGFNFTPPVDSGQVGVRLRLPQGTDLNVTNQLASILEDALLIRPEVELVQVTVGVNSSDIGNIAASERADFVVELVPRRQRNLTASDFAVVYGEELAPLLDAFPEVTLQTFPIENAGPPPVSDYSIVLASNDLALLRERDEMARLVLERSPYLTNVRSNLDTTVTERVFQVDSSRLSGTGLTISDVYQTLRAYNVGIEAARLRDSGLEIPIQVRLNPAVLRDEQALLSLPVLSPALQRGIPLGELGRFVIEEAPSAINRTNQSYTNELTATVLPGAPPVSQLRAGLRRELTEAGVMGGRITEIQGIGLDLTGDLIFYTPIAFALALLLNYLVIASQFNSFKFPLYLLLTVPLALVGALWLFFLTGTPLDVNSVLGVVILTGLVTKNAILLLDLVVNQEARKPGERLRDVLVRAGKVRLRPILMTTTTLIAISVPLLLGVGEGSEFRRPLGLIIFGGVTFSALLTLFVIPAAFYRFEHRRFDKGLEPEAPKTEPVRPVRAVTE
jgi:HAE1 family hydrophobic/amphiphilic exporter-1